jgi:hypothetical protein
MVFMSFRTFVTLSLNPRIIIMKPGTKLVVGRAGLKPPNALEPMELHWSLSTTSILKIPRRLR